MQVAPEVLFSGDLWGFLKSGHKGLFGRSGSGKSVCGKILFDAPPAPYVAIFVSPHDDLPRGRRLQNVKHLTKEVANGSRRITWKAPRELEVDGGRDEVVQMLDVLVDQAIELGKAQMKGDKAEPWCFFVIDEVQNFTSKTGYLGPVERLLSEGRKYGIRCLMISQRPARVSLEVLGQAEHVFVYELNPPDQKYLRGAGYPIDEFSGWTAQKYHFVILQVDRWAPFTPLKT